MSVNILETRFSTWDDVVLFDIFACRIILSSRIPLMGGTLFVDIFS